MRQFLVTGACTALSLLAACSRNDAATNTPPPPREEKVVAPARAEPAPETPKDRPPPVAALNMHLNGFHFANGNIHDQRESHLYCSVLNDDLTQCTIYDGSATNAKLIGVEYILNAKVFAELPEQEKALWHSHVYEVKSGQLIAPNTPEPAEHALMEKLIGTYGKMINTWSTDRFATLPLALPRVMMGFTARGQIDPELAAARDERLHVSRVDKKNKRANIPTPTVDPGADAWQQGKVVQLHAPSAAPTVFKPTP